MDEYGFSIISAWRKDNYGWIKDGNINGCNEKNVRYKERNDWKKDLLAIDMIIIKYPWMRKIYVMSLWLQEGAPVWCNRGARTELIL